MYRLREDFTTRHVAADEPSWKKPRIWGFPVIDALISAIDLRFKSLVNHRAANADVPFSYGRDNHFFWDVSTCFADGNVVTNKVLWNLLDEEYEWFLDCLNIILVLLTFSLKGRQPGLSLQLSSRSFAPTSTRATRFRCYPAWQKILKYLCTLALPGFWKQMT